MYFSSKHAFIFLKRLYTYLLISINLIYLIEFNESLQKYNTCKKVLHSIKKEADSRLLER